MSTSTDPVAPEITSTSERLLSSTRNLDPAIWGTAERINLRFYPYAGFKHTIRKRDNVVRVRVSDLLKDAPTEVIEALLKLLAARLSGDHPDPRANSLYRAFITHPDRRRDARQARRERGRKHLDPPGGDVHNLEGYFRDLNREFFEGQVTIDLLGWSPGKSKRVLGSYDAAFNAISVNRRLDNPLVPDYVVRYILFHEMLHAHLGDEYCGSRRSVHHARFKEAEQRFPDYQRAVRFIRDEL